MALLYLQQQIAPSAPPSLQDVLYFKSDDLLYWKDSTGTEHSVATAAAGLPRAYLAGLALSNNATVTKLDVAAGKCRDSTDAADITLTAAITAGLIQTSGSWAAGSTQNKLDVGARANSTWYHVYAIKKDSDATGDWLFSLSVSAPTMPTGYTYFRRIGSVFTDGSGNITAFKQLGDEFLWAASVLDVNAANPGTGAVSRALSVPSGVQVWAIVNWQPSNVGNAVSFGIYVSALDQNDEAASTSAAPLTNNVYTVAAAAANTQIAGTQLITRTDTARQVRTRAANSDASCTLRGATLGWIDRRGRDA